MIAEIIAGSCDIEGRPILRPDNRRKGFHSTFPIGRYFSRELSVHCSTLQDLANFLRGCKRVSDEEQFGKAEFWQPPDQFELTRKGDCDDWAIWTWRQLVEMGYHCRLVLGERGRYRTGHAWVLVEEDRRWFLLEPQRAYLGVTVPRLSTIAYHPELSVEYEEGKVRWFAHKKSASGLPFGVVLQFLPQWVWFWSMFWVKVMVRLPYRLPSYAYKRLFRRTKSPSAI